MDALILQPTVNTPAVSFDPTKKQLEISGESRPENVKKFYDPIISWVDNYGNELVSKGSKDIINVDLKFEYFNSSSSSCILTLLSSIKKITEKGVNVKVNWYYDRYDMDMKETGEEYTRILNLPFKLIPYEGISNN